MIVDYKGMRRPPTNSAEWQLYEWQLQTYAWLRERQPDSLPVRAGLIVFINELWPSVSDVQKLKEDMANDATDVRPANNTDDLRIVLKGPRGDRPYGLSWQFRLSRSLRLVNVEEDAQANALDRFDEIVTDIEHAVAQELRTGSITNAWPTPKDPSSVRDMCVACDFKGICPTSDYRGPALAPLGRPDRSEA